MHLSLCMIVRNEERNLQSCLDSVRAIADEIVIVDTGSTDSTPNIAAHNGAKVIPFDFARVDFAAARNQALAHATGKPDAKPHGNEMPGRPARLAAGIRLRIPGVDGCGREGPGASRGSLTFGATA